MPLARTGRKIRRQPAQAKGLKSPVLGESIDRGEDAGAAQGGPGAPGARQIQLGLAEES